MRSISLIISMLILMTLHRVRAMDLGDLIPLCGADDPKLNECVKESAQKLIPLISKGVPLLKIPPLDPLNSPEVKLSEDDHKIQMDISYTKVVQTGLSQTVFDSATVDLNGGLMIFNMTFPIFSFAGDYSAKGHVFNFQMTGDGKSNMTIQNAKSDLVINFHVVDDHIKEDGVNFHYNFDKIYLDFDHVNFNGDEELGKTAAAFINDNAVEIMNGFKPSLNRYYSSLLKTYLKSFFDAIPYSSLFKRS